MAREQEQFLDVVDRDTAERRWLSWLRASALGSEEVSLETALGRVLAADVVAQVDVPPFDRSNVDGFAVQAQDTFGATDEAPRALAINATEVATGVLPRLAVEPGSDCRLNRPAVAAFRAILQDFRIRRRLAEAGFSLDEGAGG
jgi:putative molybdopterin biosynthesis protein